MAPQAYFFPLASSRNTLGTVRVFAERAIDLDEICIDVSPAENKPIINANMATLFDYVHTSTHTLFLNTH